MVTVLFCREDSIYKGMTGVDAWDATRNALRWPGGSPVVAHPPCRAWGVLAHMAKPPKGERELAIWAVEQVRKWGGVLEHPTGSKLWRECGLPEWGLFTDEYGGYTIDLDQYHFGHVAHKPTRIYVCGCSTADLPEIPKRQGRALKSITGQVAGTKRCTQYEREYTPSELAQWMVDVARKCAA